MRVPDCTQVRNYIYGVEWLRLAAALGIIWFHTEDIPWRSIGYAGLPIFILVFCALIVIHYEEIRFSAFLKKRSVRLLIPWLFWSGVFVLAKTGRSYMGDKQASGFPSLSSFLVGGNIHLWFLPYAFLLSAVLYWLCRFAFKGDHPNHALITGISIGLILLSFYATAYISIRTSLGPPFAQWLFAFPCMPLGFYLGYLHRETSLQKRNVLYAVVFAMEFLVCWNLSRMWDYDLVVSYGIGLFLTMIAITIEIPYSRAIHHLGVLTYGIYLIHPLILFLVNRISFLHAPLVRILATFILSASVVFILRLTRLKRVL